MSDEKKDSISMSELRAILAEQAKENAATLKTVIEELKKPTAIEQKKLDAEEKELLDRNQERKENAAGILQQIEGKRQLQPVCSHKHRDGNSHCVYVMEQRGNGYILCQKNQCIIRAGNPPTNYKGNDIYSTELFNRLFQELPSNELFS